MPEPEATEARETLGRLSATTFHILLALVDSEKHGYGIMQEVLEHSEGEVRLGPGTLYGALKRLLEQGLIAEGKEQSDPNLSDERRRYYRITGAGLMIARAEARRLERLVQVVRQKRMMELDPA